MRGHISGGTRSSIGRNGTETDCSCSQTSSTGPGQVQGSVLVSSSAPANPASLSTADKLPDSANRNGSGPPGCSSSPPTWRCTTPSMLCQNGCSKLPPARKHPRTPGRGCATGTRPAVTAWPIPDYFAFHLWTARTRLCPPQPESACDVDPMHWSGKG